MTTKPEQFTFKNTVDLADADGVPIREGSVLRHIEEDDRGVVRGIVTQVIRPGTHTEMPLVAVGDIVIKKLPGTHRITNKYSNWRHIPHDEQTYRERLDSWLARPYVHDEDLRPNISRDEGVSIDGIISLLPEGAVDWDLGPFPDSIEDAMGILTEYLEKIDER